jgi:hypothetical protein
VIGNELRISTNSALNIFWDEVRYSQEATLDNEPSKVVYSEPTRQDMSGRYGSNVNVYGGTFYAVNNPEYPYQVTTFERNSKDRTVAGNELYWDKVLYSDTIELDAQAVGKYVYVKESDKVDNLYATSMTYWSPVPFAESAEMDNMGSQFVVGRRTREDTSSYNRSTEVLYSGDFLDLANPIAPYLVTVFKRNSHDVTTTSMGLYWDQKTFSGSAKLDDVGTKMVLTGNKENLSNINAALTEIWRTEFASTELDGMNSMFVVGTATREDTSNRYSGSVSASTSVIEDKEHEIYSDAVAYFWNLNNLSERGELDAEATSVVYGSHRQEEVGNRYWDYISIDVQVDGVWNRESTSSAQAVYWDQVTFSGTSKLDDKNSEWIVDAETQETPNMTADQVGVFGTEFSKEMDGDKTFLVIGKNTSEDNTNYHQQNVVTSVNINEDKEYDIFNGAIVSYWDQQNVSDNAEMDSEVSVLIRSKKTREES